MFLLIIFMFSPLEMGQNCNVIHVNKKVKYATENGGCTLYFWRKNMPYNYTLKGVFQLGPGNKIHSHLCTRRHSSSDTWYNYSSYFKTVEAWGEKCLKHIIHLAKFATECRRALFSKYPPMFVISQVLQKKQQDTKKLANISAQNEKCASDLEHNIQNMRQQQAQLQKKLKEESDRKKKLEFAVHKDQQQIKVSEKPNFANLCMSDIIADQNEITNEFCIFFNHFLTGPIFSFFSTCGFESINAFWRLVICLFFCVFFSDA